MKHCYPKLSLIVAFALLGCGSESSSVENAPTATGDGDGDGDDQQDAGDGGSTDEDPLYAIAGTSFNPDGETSYVALVPSLAGGTPIDYSAVLEVAGGASIFGMDSRRFFALGKAEEPTITRYEIDANGSLIQGEQLSLQQYGLSGTWLDPGLVPILSDTKAYLVDSEQMQVIVWNPSTMRITGSFPLDDVVPDGYSTTLFEPDPTLRGDQLLIAALHGEGDATAPFSTLIVLDTVNDEVANVTRDERCGGLWDSVIDSAGDTYFATGIWDAAQNRTLGTDIATAPCLVRVNAGEVEFDADFYLELSSLAGGNAAGGLVAGEGDEAFIKVLDEEGFGNIGPESFDEVWGGSHWQWWRISLGSNEEGQETSSLPLSAGASGVLTVDGKAYVRNANADFSETTLVQMDGGEPSEGITMRGFPYGIVRVR
jgi:hypothetical protein